MSSTLRTHLGEFLPVECVAKQQGGNNKLAEVKDSLWGFNLL